MKERHLNVALLIAALIGGFIGFVVGELIIKNLQYIIPNVVLVGLYFSQFAAWVIIACYISEVLNPTIASDQWHSNFKRKSAMLFIPTTIIAFFALGCLFQFIYSLGTVKQVQVVEPDDYCFTVDCSGSMSGDKSNSTNEAINNMIKNLKDDKRASCVCFTEESNRVIGLTDMNEAGKNRFINTVSPYILNCDGGTNIQKALLTSSDTFGTDTTGRKKAVVLVSDGIDSIDLDSAINRFNRDDISVYVIGINMGMHSVSVFEKLADKTGGRYYDAQSTAQLDFIFQNISQNVNKSNRLLVDHRYGVERTNTYYSIMRVIFITLLGIALGAILGALFDSKALMRNFMIGGLVTGCLAGLAIEYGCYHYWNIGLTRFLSDFLLSLVISLFSAVIAYEKDSSVLINKYGASSSDSQERIGTDSEKKTEIFRF